MSGLPPQVRLTCLEMCGGECAAGRLGGQHAAAVTSCTEVTAESPAVSGWSKKNRTEWEYEGHSHTSSLRLEFMNAFLWMRDCVKQHLTQVHTTAMMLV